jgi:tetratricopeptide (TPR) repeat protein
MKRYQNVMLVVLIAVAAGVAQAQQAQQQPPAQGQPAATPGQPQAKSQAEFDEFQEVMAKAGPDQQELGAMEFSLKYPDSELRKLLFLTAMRGYQNTNNAEKTIDMARKVTELDANDPEALVTLANVLAERTRETDLDREERLAEATGAAQKALQAADTNLRLPASLPPDRVEAVRNVLKSMAHSALGTVEMARKDFAAAEKHLEDAVKLNTAQPDPVAWLRLAVARDQQKKYAAALEAVNQALLHAPEGSQAAALARAERDRLQKLAGGGAGSASSSPQSSPGSDSAPPAAPQP